MKSKIMMIALLGSGITVAPAFAEQAPSQPARPGTMNYVEGTVSIDGQALHSNQVGNASLETGQEVSTENGKAEVLLTPGVFLRLDSNTTVKIDQPRSHLDTGGA